MSRFRAVGLFALVFAGLAMLAADASACSRCGLFGRRCRFASVAVVVDQHAAVAVAAPQTIVLQNNFQAPNGAAAFLAPQGQSVYGLTQAAQPYTLSPDAVLRQAAELTKGAQQLAQQGLNGYQQTASLALTLQASQPAIQAAALTAQPQAIAQQPQSQSIKLTQVNGQWTVEMGSAGGAGASTSTQPAAAPSPDSPPQADSSGGINPDLPAGPSLVAKHCASCHGLAKPAPANKMYFDAGHSLDCSPAMAAIKAVAAGKMPKGQQLTPEEKGLLIQELTALAK